MNILILGGTRFVGRAIVETALARHHEVTLFNRGTNRDILPSVRRIVGDRNNAGDVAKIADGAWDAIVDVSGYRPAEVRTVCAALGDHLPHYVYISTISVYAEPLPIGVDEGAALQQVEESIPSHDPHAYGGLKALCEQELQGRANELTILRPTVVVGPNDYTDRFPWWVRGVARGGRMPVPERLEQPVQLIDALDLAGFALQTIEQRILGTFNAVGPEETLTLRGMVDMLSSAFASHVEYVPAASRDDGSAFPLTLDADGSDDGWFSVSGAAAYRRGLKLRPLTESAMRVFQAGS